MITCIENGRMWSSWPQLLLLSWNLVRWSGLLVVTVAQIVVCGRRRLLNAL